MAETLTTTANFVGDLFLLGQNQTPFLNMIGGLNNGIRVINSTEFACGQNYSLEAGSQPEITEEASLTAPAATTVARKQEKNVVQIFQKAVTVSYAKQGNINAIGGVAVTGERQPVTNEFDFQVQAQLKQIARDANYTFLHGVYQEPSSTSTAAKTKGVLTAITTNAIEESATPQLTKDMLDELFRKCADNGMDFENAALFANSYNKQLISKMFENYAPRDRQIGGMNIKQIETDFGNVMVVYEPTMAGNIALLDMSKITAVAKNIPGKGELFYEELAKTGAGFKGQIYGELGIDYGAEAFHGKITGLATAPAA